MHTCSIAAARRSGALLTDFSDRDDAQRLRQNMLRPRPHRIANPLRIFDVRFPGPLLFLDHADRTTEFRGTAEIRARLQTSLEDTSWLTLRC